MASFVANLVKIGQLFIPTSSHTAPTHKCVSPLFNEIFSSSLFSFYANFDAEILANEPGTSVTNFGEFRQFVNILQVLANF